jgi:hypothetical protein
MKNEMNPNSNPQSPSNPVPVVKTDANQFSSLFDDPKFRASYIVMEKRRGRLRVRAWQRRNGHDWP